MRTTSYRELRKTLAATLDRVHADHEPVVITRDQGRPAAMLMPLEDFASYEETRYLLRSPANAARLLEAVEQVEPGRRTGPVPRRMKLVFHHPAWEDYLHWQAHDPRLLVRLNSLIKDCSRTPFTGTGKPEPLRGPLAGWWSRRLTQEHRLVYRPSEDGLLIAQCHYHY